MKLPLSSKTNVGWRITTLLGLITLAALPFAAWRELTSPTRAWHRAIRSSDPLIRSDAWTRVRLNREIYGLDREETIREVFAAMGDKDPENRIWAASIGPEIGLDPIVTIPRLANLLKDSEESVRLEATVTVGEMVRREGPGRNEAIEALKIALKDPLATVRLAAVAALGQVVYEGGSATDPLRSGRSDDPSLPLVAGRLVDEDLGVRVEAAYVLACNGRGDDALPMIAKMIRDQPATGPPAREADRAFLAMMVLATHSNEAASFLIAEITAPREDYPERPREALVWAAKQSPESKKRIKKLAETAMHSENPTLRHNGSILLFQAVGLMPEWLPSIFEALKDESVATRMQTVEVLADLGNVDPRIVPALQSALSDSSKEVRERAAAALEAIEWEEILSEMNEGLP